MNKNDIFKFKAPNGVEVTAIVIAIMGSTEDFSGVYSVYTHYLCYAQRRLFKYTEESFMTECGIVTNFIGYDLLVDYAILPEYDELLKESL
jgi:hypothetical protein